MAKARLTVSIHKNSEGYWIEDEGTAITGDLSAKVPLQTTRLFCAAINALHYILEELPENPKLPLVIKIKEFAEEGLKRS